MLVITYCRQLFLPLCIAAALLLTACQAPADERPAELLISAAVSLKDSLEEVQTLYEQQFPGVKLSFNFGSSGMLRQQIEQGAAVDLFLSADEAHMQRLVDKQFIEQTKQTVFLENELVAVIHTNSVSQPGDVADLLQESFEYVALGDPQTVPAGAYAKEALITFKVWDSLQPKMVFGNNVRQVLAYVETGNADIGFVYKTDALISKDVAIAFAVDGASHRSIQYFAGLVNNDEPSEQAQAFYTYLQGSEAQEIFRKHGFAGKR